MKNKQKNILKLETTWMSCLYMRKPTGNNEQNRFGSQKEIPTPSSFMSMQLHGNEEV